MGVDRPLDITANQRKTLLALLKRHLPNTTAWAYGSRVKWTARPQSDLDLVVFTAPDQDRRVSELREAFEESNLPFRVDLFVWDVVPEQFRKQIETEHVVLVEREEQSTESDWIRRKIGALGRVVTGKTPSTVEKSNFDGPYPFITIPDLDGRVFIDNTERTLSDKGAAVLRTCLLPPGAVLMSCIATVGRCGVTTRPSFTNQQINSVIPVSGVDSRFLYYVFTQLGHELESTGGGGSVYTNVSKNRFSNIEVLMPVDLAEQRTIAHILGTLDDKIELNRRMNETLEAMARALFKSWFVDFDPVRAKMAGRAPGLPQNLADLFPDRLVDSELGPIPEGWEVGCLADIATAPRRGIDPASLCGEMPYIGLEHMPRHSIALTEWGNAGKVTSNKSVFDKGDVLFGKLRPYFHKVGIAPVSGVCSTDIVVITSQTVEWSAFVLACVSSTEFVAYTDQTSTGTKMPRTRWGTMGAYPLCLPARQVAQAFQNIAQSHLDHLVTNINQSRILATQRDALLPKLISGELRISRDSDHLIENIAQELSS
ncbi:MAG: restriction endonuclease subunit S [Nitrospira sp.]|nr:restriction endonuclease subunit S [Nitrospira sp.]MDE0403686.1 restriction endonuclease subunit S [Nitrospira sp.]